MAASYWHLFIANRFIEHLLTLKEYLPGVDSILKHQDSFLSGTQGPDLNFFPGGKAEISNLAHGGDKKPADLGRNLLSIASNDKEKAYAYGWLMHLVTDIIVHPLVHKMILETFTEKYGPETDISLNVVEHRRVEWGIDLYIIKSQQHKSKLLDLSSILKSTEDLKPFIQESFLETYQYELSLDTWQNAMEGMIKYVNLFYFIWKLSGRIPDRNPLFQFGKSCFYYSILLPLFKCTEYTKLGESLSVLTPVLPTENQIIEIKECTSKTFSTYLSHLSEGFTILENRTH